MANFSVANTNGLITPYNYGDDLHPPSDDDYCMLNTVHKYGQYVGDLHYVSRPDVRFIS